MTCWNASGVKLLTSGARHKHGRPGLPPWQCRLSLCSPVVNINLRPIVLGRAQRSGWLCRCCTVRLQARPGIAECVRGGAVHTPRRRGSRRLDAQRATRLGMPAGCCGRDTAATERGGGGGVAAVHTPQTLSPGPSLTRLPILAAKPSARRAASACMLSALSLGPLPSLPIDCWLCGRSCKGAAVAAAAACCSSASVGASSSTVRSRSPCDHCSKQVAARRASEVRGAGRTRASSARGSP